MITVTTAFLEQLAAQLEQAGFAVPLRAMEGEYAGGGVLFTAAGITVAMSPKDFNECEGKDITEEIQDGKRVRVSRGGRELEEIVRRFKLARAQGVVHCSQS